MPRSTPYGAFNFAVNLNSPGVDPDSELGGFSDVSGLTTENVMVEYRVGNSKENHVRKIPLLHKVGDVTLKRGIVDTLEFFTWIKEVRSAGLKAKQDVVITLKDETGAPVRKWKLQGVVPLKYTGPTVALRVVLYWESWIGLWSNGRDLRVCLWQAMRSIRVIVSRWWRQKLARFHDGVFRFSPWSPLLGAEDFEKGESYASAVEPCRPGVCRCVARTPIQPTARSGLQRRAGYSRSHGWLASNSPADRFLPVKTPN